MEYDIEATVVNGMLKPDQALSLADGQKIRVTIHAGTSRIRQSQGLMGFSGDPKIVEQLALDPEFGLMEAP
jgi:predicted DNA-binding antitoxin AbrB/MazE fold protein